MSCTIASERIEKRGAQQSRRRFGLLGIAMLLLAGCGSGADFADEVDDEPREFTYICSKTGARQVGPLRNWPYENPAAAGGQFMLSLYCGKCGRWHVVPPPDKGRGNPLAYRCPKSGVELSVTEPKK